LAWVVLRRAGGQQYGSHSVVAQAAAHLQPVRARHHHVEDGQVGSPPGGHRQRRRAVVHRGDLETLPSKVSLDQFGLTGVVVCYEDELRHQRGSLPPCTASYACPSAGENALVRPMSRFAQ